MRSRGGLGPSSSTWTGRYCPEHWERLDWLSAAITLGWSLESGIYERSRNRNHGGTESKWLRTGRSASLGILFQVHSLWPVPERVPYLPGTRPGNGLTARAHLPDDPGGARTAADERKLRRSYRSVSRLSC